VGVGVGQPFTAKLSNEGRAGDSTVLADAGELPSAAKVSEYVFAAYVLKKDGGRGIWLVREKSSAR
jgi:hypothetical protein